MAKVLVVTDYSGMLHITPQGNKDYYTAQNKLNRDKQYGMQEMEEDAANEFVAKNFGVDPKFKGFNPPTETINRQEEEIKRLREQLAKKDEQETNLRNMLNELSTKSTSPKSEYSDTAKDFVTDNAIKTGGTTEGETKSEKQDREKQEALSRAINVAAEGGNIATGTDAGGTANTEDASKATGEKATTIKKAAAGK